MLVTFCVEFAKTKFCNFYDSDVRLVKQVVFTLVQLKYSTAPLFNPSGHGCFNNGIMSLPFRIKG